MSESLQTKICLYVLSRRGWAITIIGQQQRCSSHPLVQLLKWQSRITFICWHTDQVLTYCPSVVTTVNPHQLFTLCQAHKLYCAGCRALSGERWQQQPMFFQGYFLMTKTIDAAQREPNDTLLYFSRAVSWAFPALPLVSEPQLFAAVTEEKTETLCCSLLHWESSRYTLWSWESLVKMNVSKCFIHYWQMRKWHLFLQGFICDGYYITDYILLILLLHVLFFAILLSYTPWLKHNYLD